MDHISETGDPCEAESEHGYAVVLGFCRPCWNDLPGFIRLSLQTGNAIETRRTRTFAMGWLTGRNALRAEDAGLPAERGELTAMRVVDGPI